MIVPSVYNLCLEQVRWQARCCLFGRWESAMGGAHNSIIVSRRSATEGCLSAALKNLRPVQRARYRHK